MWVVPFENRHLEVENFNLSMLNFTWNCSSFVGTTMIIDIVFNNVLQISPLEE